MPSAGILSSGLCLSISMSSCYFKELSCNKTSWGITESCSWYSLLIQIRHISLQFYDVRHYGFYPCCLYTGSMVEDQHYVRKCNIISYLWAICHTGAWRTWLSAVLQEPMGSDGVNSFHILLGRQQHSRTVSTDTRCRHKKPAYTADLEMRPHTLAGHGGEQM